MLPSLEILGTIFKSKRKKIIYHFPVALINSKKQACLPGSVKENCKHCHLGDVTVTLFTCMLLDLIGYKMSASLVNNIHFENWSSNHVADWLKGKTFLKSIV